MRTKCSMRLSFSMPSVSPKISCPRGIPTTTICSLPDEVDEIYDEVPASIWPGLVFRHFGDPLIRDANGRGLLCTFSFFSTDASFRYKNQNSLFSASSVLVHAFSFLFFILISYLIYILSFLFNVWYVDETRCLYDDIYVVASDFYWRFPPSFWHL